MDSIYITEEQRSAIDYGKLARETARRLRRAARSQDRTGIVYFVGTQSGPIKIGRARCARLRLAELQIANHERLELLATTKGGRVAEREYHERFAEHRLHGEWFAPHPDILAEVERLSTPTTGG